MVDDSEELTAGEESRWPLPSGLVVFDTLIPMSKFLQLSRDVLPENALTSGARAAESITAMINAMLDTIHTTRRGYSMGVNLQIGMPVTKAAL